MRMDIENTELRKMVLEMLETEDRGFTDWEIEFLDNMNVWKGDYSERQANMIEKIYEKRM